MQDRLIQLTGARRSGVYVDTMVSPSMSSALAQAIQMPGVSGMDNNSVMFELSAQDQASAYREVVNSCRLAAAARMNQLVLRHTNQFFRDRRRIDVWITERDYANASLMILLAYILLGHPDWSDGEMRIFSAVAEERSVEGQRRLRALVSEGRLPISTQNVRVLPIPEDGDLASLVVPRSVESALVILGFTGPKLQELGADTLRQLPELGDALFVAADQRVFID